MSQYFSLVSIAIICVLSVYLMWHRDYEDGIIGRLALVAWLVVRS